MYHIYNETCYLQVHKWHTILELSRGYCLLIFIPLSSDRLTYGQSGQLPMALEKSCAEKNVTLKKLILKKILRQLQVNLSVTF